MTREENRNSKFYIGVDTDMDTTGIASEFSLSIINMSGGTSVSNLESGTFVEVGNTGVYNAPVRIANNGEYLLIVVHSDGNLAQYCNIVDPDNGIVVTADEIQLGTSYCVYANYNGANPKITIIDPSNDEILKSGIEGTWLNNAKMYKFCIAIPADGSAAEGTTTWCEKSAILKLYSDNDKRTYKKHVHIVQNACSTSDLCTTIEDVVHKLGHIKESEEKQTNILTMNNGIRIRAIH